MSDAPALPEPHTTGRATNSDDPLYPRLRLAQWAETLLRTPPFLRLAGVSLSDVPGELLFGHAFPSRLDHARGVYYLVRQARPRDRALQAAALAHDLGHGPFSHLSEPAMRERLGIDHEQRSVALLDAVRRALPAAAARRMAWLDWGEVGRLITGETGDGRGALLNGLLDYDNCEYVARFVVAGRLGVPHYDPRVLARALRVMTVNDGARVDGRWAPGAFGDGARPDPLQDASAVHASAVHAWAWRGTPLPSGARRTGGSAVYLLATALAEARGWQADRAVMYAYLHAGHENLALHAMLRNAVELAASGGMLPPDFFTYTDAQAMGLLCAAPEATVAQLARRVGMRVCYDCVWEAELPHADQRVLHLMADWRERLRLEARLAAEAALPAGDIVIEALVSAAPRALPPIGMPTRPGELAWEPVPSAPPPLLHVFIAPGHGGDYVRRLRMATARLLAPLGVAGRDRAPKP